MALSNALRNTYVAPQLVTSFSANKTSAFEAESVQFSWTIDTAPLSGSLSVTLKRGTTTIYSGSNASGSFTATIPDLAGTAQNLDYTLTATEIGGGGLADTEVISIDADPGIPTADSQAALTVQQPNALSIPLSGSDPNGGTLSYAVVTQPQHGTVSLAGVSRRSPRRRARSARTASPSR